jgi:transposase
MDGDHARWSPRRQWKSLKRISRIRDGRLRQRYLIVHHRRQGARPRDVAAWLGCDRSTVYRVWKRYCFEGEAGLVDRREDNGEVKVDEAYLARLRDLVGRSPPDFGWRRPTWTRELLIEQMVREVGARIAPSTMSRALKAIGARHGRPRPVVRCPWPRWRRNRRLKAIQRLIATVPTDEIAFWADEADIDLNPKIGPDWMLTGQQKEVVTPGQNVKRYVAGAMDVRTRLVTWVTGTRKSSELFTWLLWRLWDRHREARVIHLIVDNARIHSSRYTRRTIEGMPVKVVLHFLPPYCPEENPIERVWLDLHANVTRNHRCPTIQALVREVVYYLTKRNRRFTRRLARETTDTRRRAA